MDNINDNEDEIFLTPIKIPINIEMDKNPINDLENPDELNDLKNNDDLDLENPLDDLNDLENPDDLENPITIKKTQYNKFIELNNEMETDYDHMILKIKVFDNDSYKKITFTSKKNKFDINICNKLTKLSQKIRIMDKKNSTYKNCFDCVNISIILLSTILTLTESFKNEFDDHFSIISKKYLKLSPIIISSIITCSASILKFKKFQEKIELLTKIKEKGVLMITKFKKLKENIYYVETNDNLNKLIKYYNKEIYEQYALIQQEISQCISSKDYKYLSPIFETDSKIHILNNKRSFFFNNYDYPKNQINADFVKKKCCNKNICCCLK
jgi:hypothetical protein